MDALNEIARRFKFYPKHYQYNKMNAYYAVLSSVVEKVCITFWNCELAILAYSNFETNSRDMKKDRTS